MNRYTCVAGTRDFGPGVFRSISVAAFVLLFFRHGFPGDSISVTFVVDAFDPGELDCHITEDPVPDGYAESYAAGAYSVATADWTCQNVRSLPFDTTLGTENGTLWFEGNPDTESTGPLFPHYGGTSVCTVTENVAFSAAESDDSDCASLPISIGMGNSCTITNVVFFEGIPTLNQYGLAVLALLMLGVGLVGFRRLS